MFETRTCWGPTCANETPAGVLPPLCSEACRVSWKASLDYLSPVPAVDAERPAPGTVIVDEATGIEHLAGHPAPVARHGRVELRIEPRPTPEEVAEVARRWSAMTADVARAFAELSRAVQANVDALAATFRHLLPPTPPKDPMQRALFLRQNRNTGPAKPLPRAPRHLDTTARRRTR